MILTGYINTTLPSNFKEDEKTGKSDANSEEFEKQWSWINDFHWYKNKDGKPIDQVEVELSQWLFDRIVKDRTVLSIHAGYFKLTKGLEKWLYRIARRHCGNQDVIQFTIQGLFRRYPTTGHFRQFKHQIKQMIEDIQRRDKLGEEPCFPEYKITWNCTDNGKEYIIITPKLGSREERTLPRSARGLLQWD